MPLHSYFAIVAFLLLLLILFIQLIGTGTSLNKFLGSPTIEKINFYSAKITIFTTWGLFIVKAVLPSIGYITTPLLLSWLAIGMLFLGTTVFSVAVIQLGTSLKVGLPDEQTQLQTKGIYRLSRNPIYLGAYIIAIASCIYFCDLINIAFTCYSMVIHHKIILNEEQFLEGRFGSNWLIYKSKVSRYL